MLTVEPLNQLGCALNPDRIPAWAQFAALKSEIQLLKEISDISLGLESPHGGA